MVEKSDTQLNGDVVEELNIDPTIQSDRISIAVHDGSVTLTGSVPSYWQKLHAEKAIKRVIGVRALADDLKVELPGSHVRDDSDIAAAAASALRWHSDLPDSVKATVRNGWITLTGEVKWHFQRDTAEEAVHHIKGAYGVLNEIELQPNPHPVDVRKAIKAELERTVDRDANKVDIETTDGHVKLTGSVRSWLEDSAVRRASWSVPGVTEVEDLLVIR
ncbi:BON domain-containing protein [Mycolicibacterium fortuitum]|uniref:BON domain-containing protein n=1 Tax=Mycolicibacterium fortuitum TaxID=1766 RepID=UPI001CE14A0F|nr:BON domain-containing protein [Mycolicibacterium fortuitum]MCA4727289.1 BON domain-containing protein [Mycolicibacterium fortuitum]